MEYLEAEILWNYFPEGTVVAEMEVDINELEYQLDKDIEEIEGLENWKQIIRCENQPKNACIIQGEVILFNIKTGKIIETNNTTCLQNQDIIKIYQDKKELIISSTLKIEY